MRGTDGSGPLWTVEPAARLLADARRVVVFSGAGISAESGVPTFRDDLGGLWARFEAQQLATPEASTPIQTSSGAGTSGGAPWFALRSPTPATGPSPPSRLACPAPSLPRRTSTTSTSGRNPGRDPPAGSLFGPRCVAAAAHPATFEDPGDGEPAGSREGRIPTPRCGSCGSLVRPGVVLFGEALPEAALPRRPKPPPRATCS